MAITRAQIPEQVDLFDGGGGVGDVSTSLTPEDIIALYGAQTSAPVTAADIQAQSEQLAGLFPQERKQNNRKMRSGKSLERFLRGSILGLKIHQN